MNLGLYQHRASLNFKITHTRDESIACNRAAVFKL